MLSRKAGPPRSSVAIASRLADGIEYCHWTRAQSAGLDETAELCEEFRASNCDVGQSVEMDGSLPSSAGPWEASRQVIVPTAGSESSEMQPATLPTDPAQAARYYRRFIDSFRASNSR